MKLWISCLVVLLITLPLSAHQGGHPEGHQQNGPAFTRELQGAGTAYSALLTLRPNPPLAGESADISVRLLEKLPPQGSSPQLRPVTDATVTVAIATPGGAQVAAETGRHDRNTPEGTYTVHHRFQAGEWVLQFQIQLANSEKLPFSHRLSVPPPPRTSPRREEEEDDEEWSDYLPLVGGGVVLFVGGIVIGRRWKGRAGREAGV